MHTVTGQTLPDSCSVNFGCVGGRYADTAPTTGPVRSLSECVRQDPVPHFSIATELRSEPTHLNDCVLLALRGITHTNLILQRILPRQAVHGRTHTRIHALVRVIRDRRARWVAVDDVAFMVGYFGVLGAVSIGDADDLNAVYRGTRTVTGHLASGSEDRAG